MKSQTIRLTGKKQVDYAAKLINECLDQPELWCCEVKKYKEAKTLQQLRALFGTWYDYLSETLGETKDDLHIIHKTGFRNEVGDGEIKSYRRAGYGGWLKEIYKMEPEGVNQRMWAEIFWRHINSKELDSEALMIHMLDISLSWATIDQMREYMKRIEHYYLNAGYPLPILEKFKRWYL